MAKPVVRLDVGGTLTFAAPEGTPLATPGNEPSVNLFDEGRAAYTTGAPFTITASSANLSVTIPAGLADDLGDNFRAEWTYTVGSTIYVHNQLFEVRAYGFFKTLTATELASLHPIVSGRPAQNTSTVHGNAITYAYDRIQALMRAKGANPNKIVDPQPFEHALAAWSAAHVLRNLSPGTANTDAWQAMAADLWDDGRRLLDTTLADVDLYGEDSDGGVDSAVASAKLNRVIFTR